MEELEIDWQPMAVMANGKLPGTTEVSYQHIKAKSRFGSDGKCGIGYSGCVGSVLGRKLATLPIVKSEKKQPKVIIINYDSLMQGPQVPPPRKTRRLRRKNQRNKRCGPYSKFAHKRKMKCVTGEE